jgi:heptosyltransferase II
MQGQLNRILVVTKYRFIGDTLTAIPTIRAVKEQWPNASVSLLSGARACELLQNCPYIDQFIEFDPYRTSDQGLGRYVSLLNKLRQEKFDLALVLNRSFHSALTAALGGAKKRVGWSGFEGRDFLLTERCAYDKVKPEIDCFLDVYRAASWAEPANRQMEVWLHDRELAESSNLLPREGHLAGFQPGATHDYKQWPRHYFSRLAEEMMDRNPNQRFILIGGPEEKHIADGFLERAPKRVVDRTTNFVGKLSLRMTLAVVSQLDLFVGNDTAIRHAAVAFDTPSIGIFGPTSYVKWGNSNPPRHVVVTASTGKMVDVSVEDVLSAVDMLYDIGSRSKAALR